MVKLMIRASNSHMKTILVFSAPQVQQTPKLVLGLASLYQFIEIV